MNNSRAVPRWIFLAALLAILCTATGLRLHQLPERPLGLHYDEAANGILASEIARGLERPIFIGSYTGKEVLFFYWTALWMKLLGATPLALRLSAALIGVATVMATVWAVYELLQDYPDALWTGLIAAAFLAASFWHLVLSRYGFRAVTQPLLQALTVAALWRGLRFDDRRWSDSAGFGWLVIGGVFFGLTAYTYLAARAFPVPVAAGLVTLIAADGERRRKRLTQLSIFVGVAALILAPLAHYWITHPGSFTTRARQVAADTWMESWNGLLACLRMFFVAGDPYVRFNLPGRPLFSPIVAGLFLLGIGIGIYRLVRALRNPGELRRPLALAASVFLLASVPVMLLPSALATDEITPSNLRTVGLLPFIYVFPTLGLWALVAFLRRCLAGRTSAARFFLPAACLLALALLGAYVAPAYLAWSSSAALYEAADGDIADAARHLNVTDLSTTTAYVASQHYRHPTLAFLAEDYDAIRWLAGGRTLVFPPQGDALFVFPRSAGQDLDWIRSMLPESALVDTGIGPGFAPAFYIYRSDIAESPVPEHRYTANLGQVAQLKGYTVTNQPRSDGHVDIAVWWEVTGAADQPDYHAVARLADSWGSIWGETQPFHYPSEQWTEGELIVDHLSIPIDPGAPPGEYAVRFGLYAPGADVRMPVLNEGGAYAGLYVELPVRVARARMPVSVDDLIIGRRMDRAIDGLTLLGTRLTRASARPGERLHLTLFWRAEEANPPPRELALHLGETTLYRGAPAHGTYPFNEWAAGEIVADRYAPRLPLDIPPGQHPLQLHIGDQAPLKLADITVERTDRTFEAPPISHSRVVTLGRQVQLLGYDLSSDLIAPGETLTLTLTWRALTEMSTDYTVFTHVLAPDGSMAGQQDRQPVAGTYPTSLWVPREVVRDVYAIPVSAAAAPGEHRLEVGMYVAETGTRLSVPETDDDAVTLQSISVTE